MSQHTRREVVAGLAALGAGTLTGCGVLVQGDDCALPTGSEAGAPPPPPADTAAGGSDTGAAWRDTALVEVNSCEGTAAFDEGPYYREDAPSRSDLRTAGESGTTFELTLIVRGGSDCALLSDAAVDFWHVAQSGVYDMESSEMHYRARLQTGFDGRVVLTTLKPISYTTETGQRMPAHFHLKVSAHGHELLTTQLRFVDDPDDDGSLPESLMLSPTVASDGSEAASYTVVLIPA